MVWRGSPARPSARSSGGDYSPSVTLALKLAKLCQVSVEDIFSYEENVRNEAEK